MPVQQRETLVQAVIRSGEYTEAQAKAEIETCRNELHRRISEGDLCGADDILSEYFGLEPDWLDELI